MLQADFLRLDAIHIHPEQTLFLLMKVKASFLYLSRVSDLGYT